MKSSPKPNKGKNSSIPHTDSKIKKKNTKESRTTSTSVNKINEAKTTEEKIIDKVLKADPITIKSENQEVTDNLDLKIDPVTLKSERKTKKLQIKQIWKLLKQNSLLRKTQPISVITVKQDSKITHLLSTI